MYHKNGDDSFSRNIAKVLTDACKTVRLKLNTTQIPKSIQMYWFLITLVKNVKANVSLHDFIDICLAFLMYMFENYEFGGVLVSMY